jgi:carbon monoxide dehydrogenase subunit G
MGPDEGHLKDRRQAVLHAPADQVWAALLDPAVLVAPSPAASARGDGPDSYAMTVTAGVASIKGVYSGTCRAARPAAARSLPC